MAIPTYDKFIEPILRYLAQHPEGAPASTLYEASSAAPGISDEDKQVLLSSLTQPIYKNRAGWAHDRLKRAGLSSSPPPWVPEVANGRHQLRESASRSTAILKTWSIPGQTNMDSL